MKKRKLLNFQWLVIFAFIIGLSGCSEHNVSKDHGVYMLLDTSGTFDGELPGAQKVINKIISEMQPGDTFAVQRIDSESFNKKDIIYSKTFDRRPSTTNQQKRVFRTKIDEFIKSIRPSAYTDITGGILQGIEYLNESEAEKKTILIFSDMKEELPKNVTRDVPLQLDGYRIFALNVTKLKGDKMNPNKYYDRLGEWKSRIETGGGSWAIINNLERIDAIFE